jgi:hypothetical protein
MSYLEWTSGYGLLCSRTRIPAAQDVMHSKKWPVVLNKMVTTHPERIQSVSEALIQSSRALGTCSVLTVAIVCCRYLSEAPTASSHA